MIVVKNVEVVETKGRKMIIENFPTPSALYYQPGQGLVSKEEAKITPEEVEGHEFVNERGESVIIGWTKDAQDALGLPFRVFQNLQDENDRLKNNVETARKEKEEFNELNIELAVKLAKIQNMDFWQRLRFLFTRKLPFKTYGGR